MKPFGASGACEALWPQVLAPRFSAVSITTFGPSTWQVMTSQPASTSAFVASASRTAFVAHSGLTVSPALKWLCDQNGTVFITRDRRQTVTGQVAQIREALGRRRLTIFPEGTTGDGRALRPFKSALLSAVGQLPAEIPVQPVALVYDEAEEIAWVDAEPGLRNACRILGRTHRVHLILRFLPPLSGPALADRKAMAAAARETIGRELDG